MTGDAADRGRSDGEAAFATERERRSTTWLDVFDDVLDEVVDDGETVEAEFDDLRVEIPIRYGADADRAEWGFDGAVTVHVEGLRGPLAEWMRWWYAAGDGAGR
jgi:hypothetical protein